jgi:hypothetical protein
VVPVGRIWDGKHIFAHFIAEFAFAGDVFCSQNSDSGRTEISEMCIETYGAILQPVTKVGFIYPLVTQPFGDKKGKPDFEDVLNWRENIWTETMLK